MVSVLDLVDLTCESESQQPSDHLQSQDLHQSDPQQQSSRHQQEAEPETSGQNLSYQNSGFIFFTVVKLLENLHILGLHTFFDWERAVNGLKTNQTIINDPVLTQMYGVLRHFFKKNFPSFT